VTRRRWQCQWFFGHHNPRNGIGTESHYSQYRRDQPYNPHQGDVQIEVFGHSGAHAGNFAARARADKPLASYDCAYSLAAVRAMRRIILNDFAAVIAVHSFASAESSS
jgi:hypothetical protein